MALRSPPYNPTELTPFKPIFALPLAAQKIKFSRVSVAKVWRLDSGRTPPSRTPLLRCKVNRRARLLDGVAQFAHNKGNETELYLLQNYRVGYAPMYSRLEDFEVSLLCLRIQDRFNRPIASARDTWFDVLERYSNDYETHKMSWKSVANFVGKPATIVFRMVMSHTLLFFLSKGGRFASFTQIDDF
ncbi:hypothetical protein EV1_020429 [Malus domestica]